MKKSIFLGTAILAVFLLTALLPAPFSPLSLSLFQAQAASAGDVVINEIAWAGSDASSADEYIELRNTTGSIIDLSNWVIEKAAPSDGDLTIPAGKSIPANGLFLIANYPKTHASSALDVDVDWDTTDVSLPNSGLELILRDGVGGTIIDTADDDSGAPFAGGSNPYISMERKDTPGDGTQTANWYSAIVSINFDNTNNKGTPGRANVEEIPNVTSLQASETTSSATTLSWTAPSPALSGISYNITSDPDVINASTTDVTYQASGLSANTTYTFTVKSEFQSQESSGESADVTTLSGGEPSRDVVINEIAWAGSDASNADEYIELRNSTGSDIDLTNWVISGAASAGGDLTITSGTISANGLFLIANYSKTHGSSALDVEADFVTTAVSLSNSDLQLTLKNSTGTTIDIADDGAGVPLAGDSTIKASMERRDTPGDGTQAANWYTAIVSINFDDTVNKGTPGYANVASISNITNLSTNNITSSSVDLSWTKTTTLNNQEVYRVYMQKSGETETGPTNMGNVSSYSVSSLDPGTDYTFRVTTYISDEESSGSSAQATTLVPNPANLQTGEMTSNSTTLSWTAPAPAVAGISYNVYKDSDLLGNTSSLSYQVTNLTPLTSYTMTVKSLYNQQQSSGLSIQITTSAQPGNVPLDFFSPVAVPFNPEIIINQNVATTITQEVSLELKAQDAGQMAISNTADFARVSWQPYQIIKSWLLSAEEGVKTVYAKFRNLQGQVSSVVFDTIIYSPSAQKHIAQELDSQEQPQIPVISPPQVKPAAPQEPRVIVPAQGLLIKISNAPYIYFVQGNNLKYIRDMATFRAYGFSESDIALLSQSKLGAYTLTGYLKPPAGSYVQGASPSIYKVNTDKSLSLVLNPQGTEDIIKLSDEELLGYEITEIIY